MLVWAFKRLEELNDEVGYVTCDDKMATKLLKSGKVQDLRAGANALKYIDYSKREAPIKKANKQTAKPKVKATPKTTKEK